ncbi:FecR family protein [Taibaiella chishuiensis]|uniref:FecR family protein n=1 Tax=Taibaiella chishuiensis TaxID=1434707 RepID=A0A2P8DBJ6_9BACT|nr:FecR domain-containing protein [Taibaiella chishuiensis]PSK94555.1 FecR family protein [Taibaiella chishuiensis]
MDELLVKYLLGETSAEESRMAEQWINASKDNKRYYDHFRLIWEESLQLTVTHEIDENDAWARFQQRIAPQEQEQDTATSNNVIAFPVKKKKTVWRAAAAVAVLMFGAWVAHFYYETNANRVTLASSEDVRIDTLPDGSVVTLNKNSSLAYARDFKGNVRAVTLKGEAFFNVAPNKAKPFEITVDDVTVRVVGTSFNVKNTRDKTEIIVETGIVTVAKRRNQVKLLPKQKATVLKKDDAPVIEKNSDELYNFYRTQEFVCNNTPLHQLVDALNESYNAKITINNPAIRNLPITTTFHRKDPLNLILGVIVETQNIQIEQKDGKIMLK